MSRRNPIAPILFLGLSLAALGFGREQARWELGPFSRELEANPVLGPQDGSTFFCPLGRTAVNWEAGYVYNPAAVVKDGKVWLLYRAQAGKDLKFGMTSRIGLAWSEDGVRFSRAPRPVLYPDQDFMKKYEWPGGCEDPRIVESPDGTYYLTYTAFNGRIARLCVASSPDLVNWTKHGLAFGHALGGRYRNLWSKSGAIVCELQDGRPIAKMINGTYWMYWGDQEIYLATSEDLIDWTPLERKTRGAGPRLVLPGFERNQLERLLVARPGNFDSDIVEPGPPPILTDHGIVFIYNARNQDHPQLPRDAYAAGQALIDPTDPTRPIDRTDSWFLRPEQPFERSGLVENVVFTEGLVWREGRCLLYYGAADATIGLAVSPNH